MNLLDLAGYFVGRRQSIERIASSPGALLVGGLFVLSAGFAREYDGEDLWRDPWYVLLPLAASLATSLVLYGLLYVVVYMHAASSIEPLVRYRQFLSLYWMTAPLAWIYAIPAEQLTTPGQAMRMNLWFLGVVALWRVLLITRSASVLFGASYRSMFVLVMLFADTLALVILWFTPLPVFNVMGGIRLTESEVIIQGTAFMVGFVGGITLPVWLVSSLVVMGSKKKNWQPMQSDPQPVSWGVWAVAACSILVWGFVLPFSQPSQRLASQVERDLKNDNIQEALNVMSQHDRESFPVHWDPPPWPGYNQDVPPLLDVMETLQESPSPDWVRDIYIEKLLQQIGPEYASYYFLNVLESLGPDDLKRYLKVLERTPETHEAIRKHSFIFDELLRRETESSSDTEQAIRQFIEKLDVTAEVNIDTGEQTFTDRQGESTSRDQQ